MDQYFTEILVCIITGAFTILSLYVQKKQDKVVEKIDKKTMFMEKEKLLQNKISTLSKQRESIIHNMMILIMDTNLELMKAIETSNNTTIAASDEVYRKAKKLKEEFDKNTSDINAINKEYEIVVEMAAEAQKEIDKLQADSKKKS